VVTEERRCGAGAERGERLAERGDLFQSQAQGDEVARVAAAAAQASERAFQVPHVGERGAEGFEPVGVFEERLDGDLSAADGFGSGERLREPVAQAARAHGRDGAVEHAVETGGAGCVAVERFEHFQMPQRGGVQAQELVALIKPDAGEVARVAPQMLGQVMKRGAGSADRGGTVLEAKAVERGDLEMFAQRVGGGFGREGPVVVTVGDPAEIRFGRFVRRRRAMGRFFPTAGGGRRRGTRRVAAQHIRQCRQLARINNFRRSDAFQLGEQRGVGFDLGGEEIAGGQVHEHEAEAFCGGANGGQEIVAVGGEQPFVEVRARRKDLGDLAFDELAGAGFFELVANGDLASGAEQPPDVGGGGVVGQTAHGHAVAAGEREVEQLRADLRVLEEHLVKIAKAKQQESVPGQLALDAAILRHHRRQPGFGGHRTPE